MFLTAWTALFNRDGFFSVLVWAFALSFMNDDVEEVMEAASKDALGLESPGMLWLVEGGGLLDKVCIGDLRWVGCLWVCTAEGWRPQASMGGSSL